MRLLVLHGFADGFVVWLILGDVKLHASVGLDLIFLRYENDCSHAYVDPNKVNTAILIRCSVSYMTGSAFQVLIISLSSD